MYDSTYLWQNSSKVEKNNKIVVASGGGVQGMNEKRFEETSWRADSVEYLDI